MAACAGRVNECAFPGGHTGFCANEKNVLNCVWLCVAPIKKLGGYLEWTLNF